MIEGDEKGQSNNKIRRISSEPASLSILLIEISMRVISGLIKIKIN